MVISFSKYQKSCILLWTFSLGKQTYFRVYTLFQAKSSRTFEGLSRTLLWNFKQIYLQLSKMFVPEKTKDKNTRRELKNMSEHRSALVAQWTCESNKRVLGTKPRVFSHISKVFQEFYTRNWMSAFTSLHFTYKR